MADTVDSVVMFAGTRRRIVRLLNISDGTGESAVVKVDKSALIGPDGTEPSKLVIEEIQWSIQGFTSVRLFWDHTTDDEIAILGTGSGYFSYVGGGGLSNSSSGGTGDIILTTAGTTSGNTYDITLVLRLKD